MRKGTAMTKYFSQDTPLAGLERMMMSVPGFQKRGGGMMVLCRFHYKKEDVDCTYCRSYMRHTCQESVCPYIPERLEAGTIGYQELAERCLRMAGHQKLWKRASSLSKGNTLPLALEPAHRHRLSEWPEAGTASICPQKLAAVYLLSSRIGLWRRVLPHISHGRIDFSSVSLRGIDPRDYPVYRAAKGLYCGKLLITSAELADEEQVTDIFGEMAQYGGAGIVQHHTGNMEHPADHIDGMVGAVEVLLQLDHLAAGIQNFNITPGIDIDLLNTGAEDVLGEEAKLGHLGVESVHQLFPGQIPDSNSPVLDIFADVSLDLLLGIRSHTICDEGGIFAGDIFLNILQYRTEILTLTLRCEEQGVDPLASSCFRGNSTPGQVICIGECCRRGLGLKGWLNRLIQRRSLQRSLLLLQNRLRGLNGAAAGTKQRIVSLLS